METEQDFMSEAIMAGGRQPGTVEAPPHYSESSRECWGRFNSILKHETPDPAPISAPKPIVITEERGPFTVDNTEQMLSSIRDRNPEFDFTPAKSSLGHTWWVRCPGTMEHGWHDGAQHSQPDSGLSSASIVWVNDRGFADFKCFHAHCDGREWKAFVAALGAADLQRVITKRPEQGPFFGSNAGTVAGPEAPPFFSDQALAENFTQLNQDQIAYLDRGKWATFVDSLWVEDPNDLAAQHRAQLFLLSQLPEVDARVTGRTAVNIKNRLCATQTQRNVVFLAKQRPGIFRKSEEFDRDAFLIGAPQGKVVDLRTGTIRPSTPGDLLMKAISCLPSSAPRPRWEKFMDEITDDDKELKEYLQRMAGSWLTASPKDQTLTVFHGHGGNGKGTFIGVIQHILGPYSQTIPVDSLVTKRSGDTDLGGVAMLCGARLAVAQEGDTTRRFNAGLLKTLTGGDELTGRLLYENKFSFKPTHKLVILTNNKPRIDLDGGIRRRLHLVPFTRSFEGAAKNVNLKEELLEEASGILSWMIEGCLAWLDCGLDAPSSVTEYTKDYLEEFDDLNTWIEQNCIVDPKAWEASSDLFGDWKIFCEVGRLAAGTLKDFIERLEGKRFKKKRNNAQTRRGVMGLKLRNLGIREVQ
jgi:putative DNA primase/helicase